MKHFVLIMLLVCSIASFASSVEWNAYILDSVMGYPTVGYAGTQTYADSSISFSVSLSGREMTLLESGWTSLNSFTAWSLAYSGEVISDSLVNDLSRLFFNGDGHGVYNPIVVDVVDDAFYLAFKAQTFKNPDLYEKGVAAFGWVEIGVSYGDLYVKSSAIALDGSQMLVGGGAIPEPTSGLLFLFGLAALALKRSRSDYV